MRGWVEAGEIEGVRRLWDPSCRGRSCGEGALAADLAEAIPELVRLTELEVRIPRFEVVALERLAAVDGANVSAVLARELLDLVSRARAMAVTGGARIRGGAEWAGRSRGRAFGTRLSAVGAAAVRSSYKSTVVRSQTPETFPGSASPRP
jgi:hypothetical protein